MEAADGKIRHHQQGQADYPRGRQLDDRSRPCPGAKRQPRAGVPAGACRGINGSGPPEEPGKVDGEAPASRTRSPATAR